MEIIFLFIIYLAFGIAGLKYILFFKHCKISFRLLVFIFLLKVGAGILYGTIHQKYYEGGDTHLYVKSGALIQSHIYEDVALFVRLCFGPNNVKPSPELKPHVQATYIWTDTSAYTLARLNALIAFFGKGNYALHIIFWQLFSLIGLVALYKSFIYFYANEKRKLLLAIFFLPSIIFWHSGIHKEALSIAAIGLLTWSVIQCSLKQKKYFLYAITFLFLGILSLIRVYTLAIILPAAVLLYYSIKQPKKILLKYVAVYGVLVLMGFALGSIHKKYHFLNHFIEIQDYFEFHSIGTSDVPIISLEPNLVSLLTQTPKALFRTLWRPSLFDVNQQNLFMKLPSALETLLIVLLILVGLFSKKLRWLSQQPLLIYSLVITVLYLSLIGLLVPNLGALFRYKSVVLPLLLPTLILLIDFKKLSQLKSQIFRK